jgi:hypothetical protein
MSNLVPQISQAASALSNLALISPIQNYGYGPISSLGASFGQAIGNGWVFTYEGENTFEASAETTDHYIETNSAVNQHIALAPEVITVHGYKGEIENLFPSLVIAGLPVQSVLGAISNFSPSFSVSATNTINQANQVYQEATAAANAGVGAWNTLNGGNGPNVITGQGITLGENQNNQQSLFAQIYGYFRQQIDQTNPILFNVQIPWAIVTPCALIRMRAIQEETTNTMTDFFLTFKLMRFVSTSIDNLVSVGRAANYSSPLSQNGTITPKNSIGLSDAITNAGN